MDYTPRYVQPEGERMELPQIQYDVLNGLGKLPEPINITELAVRLGRDQSPVMAACTA